MKTLMLATLVQEPFDAKGWIFEVKWDGYRALAQKSGKKIRLVSRGQKSWKERFPTIVQELEKMSGNFMLDGEIVILDKKGRSHFQLLQNSQKNKTSVPYYYVFDILAFNGKNLTQYPLIERKKLLEALLKKGKHPHIRFSDHILEKGKAFFQKAKKKGLEGIIAKKADSTYQFQRSRDWLKIKTGMRQEVVIGGFTAPRGARKWLGSLLVGVYEGKKLVYAGHVGGGFNQKLLGETYQQLKKMVSAKCPFATQPKTNGPVTWVKPKLVCEVAFAEWTKEGIMRQPIFKGMRGDKKPHEVIRERA